MIEKKENLLSIGKTAKIIGVTTTTLRRWDEENILSSVRSKAGTRYYRKSDIEQCMVDRNDLIAIAKKWVLDKNPRSLEPSMYCETRDVFSARLHSLQSELERKYGSNDVVSFLVPAVVGEIGNNSFDHNVGNWPDIPGIFFAHNSKQRIIVLADRGQGVFNTLSRMQPLADDKEALLVAFTKVISGRYPEARGNGLKFVRSIIINNPLTLMFQSGNAKLNLSQNVKDVDIKEANNVMRGCFTVISY